MLLYCLVCTTLAMLIVSILVSWTVSSSHYTDYSSEGMTSHVIESLLAWLIKCKQWTNFALDIGLLACIKWGKAQIASGGKCIWIIECWVKHLGKLYMSSFDICLDLYVPLLSWACLPSVCCTRQIAKAKAPLYNGPNFVCKMGSSFFYWLPFLLYMSSLFQTYQKLFTHFA